MYVKKIMGVQIGFGVFLCILAPAMFILLLKLIETGVINTILSRYNSGISGLITLFIMVTVMVTVAVGIFIYSGMKFKRYQYMENGVQLPNAVKERLQLKYESFKPSYYLSLILGVCLIVISPIAIIIKNEYGVVILLGSVAVAVFLFISFGMVRESYSRLFNVNEYAVKNN